MLLFIYDDFLGKGGIPQEFRSIVSALATNEPVVVLTRKGSMECKIKAVDVVFFSSITDGISKLRQLIGSNSFNLAILATYFSIYGLSFSKYLKRQGIKTVLYPTNQVNGIVFSRDLFGANPDIRALETAHGSKRIPSNSLNVLKKRIFTFLIGKRLLFGVNAIAVLSEFEKKEILRLFPGLKEKSFFVLRWVFDGMNEQSRSCHFYHDTLDENKFNIVYWGRIDYWMKGIGRLLDGVAWAKSQNRNLPFRLFLMGPDYHSSVNQVRQKLERLSLEEDVRIFLPGEYTPGNLDPLRDADASVLLSRWDGIPRAVRESISLGIPVLVSEETHLKSQLSRYGGGICVDGDDAKSVGRALLRASSRQNDFEVSTFDLAKTFSAEYVANEFLDCCRGENNEK